MPKRLSFLVSFFAMSILGAAPVRATTEYTFSATIDGEGTSFGNGASIEFAGFLTDPTLLPGEGTASAIEVTRLAINGVSQNGVEAVVLLLSSPTNRFELLVTFLGANNPDITLVVDLPGGIEADFPEIDFDLAEVAVVTAEINEDGILPVDLNLTALGGTPASEHVVDGGFDDPAHPAWTFEKYDTSSTIAWSSDDAVGSPSSGSLSLDKAVGENPNSLRAGQCIALAPGGTYALSGNLFWPSASTMAGEPYLSVAFYGDSECSGSEISSFFPSVGDPPRDAWTALPPKFFEPPPGARFGLLYAGVIIDVSLGSSDFFAASWDDVSVVPEPGSAATLAALGALAWLSRRRSARGDGVGDGDSTRRG